MQAQVVRGPVHLQPHVGADLVVADHSPHGRSKDFRAAARQRSQPGFLEPLQDFLHRHPGEVRVIGDFNGRKSLQVDRREALFQPAKEIDVILERQVGMEAADNVKFGHGFRPVFARDAESFLQRHGVRSRSVRLAPESAQLATGHADIGGIEVAIDVKVRALAVHLFTDMMRQVTEGEDVARIVKRHAVVKV